MPSIPKTLNSSVYGFCRYTIPQAFIVNLSCLAIEKTVSKSKEVFAYTFGRDNSIEFIYDKNENSGTLGDN